MKDFNNNRFKAIVRALRQMVRCPHCAGTFSENDIEMVSNYGPIYAVKMSCGKCGLRVIASLTQIENNKSSLAPYQSVAGQVKSFDPKVVEKGISADDMLAFHEYIQEFDGDFKSVFNS